VIGNHLGIADTDYASQQAEAATWLYIAFIPLALIGAAGAWRLAGPAMAGGAKTP
jgi:hypothetical protein